MVGLGQGGQQAVAQPPRDVRRRIALPAYTIWGSKSTLCLWQQTVTIRQVDISVHVGTGRDRVEVYRTCDEENDKGAGTLQYLLPAVQAEITLTTDR